MWLECGAGKIKLHYKYKHVWRFIAKSNLPPQRTRNRQLERYRQQRPLEEMLVGHSIFTSGTGRMARSMSDVIIVE